MPIKNDLSSQDICTIIESCSKNKVTRLQWGSLQINFTVEPEKLPALSQTSPDNEISADQHENQTQQALEQDELALRDERLAMAIVENPSEFEQMLNDEDLDDTDEPNDE